MTEQEKRALDAAFTALHRAICAPRTRAASRAQEVLDRAEYEIRGLLLNAEEDEVAEP